MGYDTACETAFSIVEPCLEKGDMLFVIQSNYMESEYSVAKGEANSMNAVDSTINEESGNLYTITKIYKEDPTASTFNRGTASVLLWIRTFPSVAKISLLQTPFPRALRIPRPPASSTFSSSHQPPLATTSMSPSVPTVAPVTRAPARASRATRTTTATSRAPSLFKDGAQNFHPREDRSR